MRSHSYFVIISPSICYGFESGRNNGRIVELTHYITKRTVNKIKRYEEIDKERFKAGVRSNIGDFVESLCRDTANELSFNEQKLISSYSK